MNDTLDQMLDTEAAKAHNEQVKADIMKEKALFSRVFNNEDGKAVLKRLEEFCYFNKTSADPMNPYATYIAEGRRETLLVMREVLNL